MKEEIDAVKPGLVFLKDTWRVLDQPPEHEWNKGRTRKLRTLRHYRLVLEHIEFGIADFNTVRELVTAIRDAYIAFDDAFFKAKILHRDISIGNIRLKRIGNTVVGYLIDWDLCKPCAAVSFGSRHFERTGTWAFLSANLVQGSKQHTRLDDAESFYHVLSYMASRYLDHQMPMATLASFIHDSFMNHTPGAQQKAIYLESKFPASRLTANSNPRIRDILTTLAQVFGTRYQFTDYTLTTKVPLHPLLETEYWLSNYLTAQLELSGWDVFHGRVDREAELKTEIERQSRQ